MGALQRVWPGDGLSWTPAKAARVPVELLAMILQRARCTLVVDALRVYAKPCIFRGSLLTCI